MPAGKSIVAGRGGGQTIAVSASTIEAYTKEKGLAIRKAEGGGASRFWQWEWVGVPDKESGPTAAGGDGHVTAGACRMACAAGLRAARQSGDRGETPKKSLPAAPFMLY